MSKITFKSLLFVVLAIIPMTFFGQENNDTQKKAKTNYWFIDADAGGAFLAGDNGNLKFNRMRFNGRVGGGYAFAKCLTAYGKVGFGTLSATKENFFTTDMVSYVSYDLNVSIDLINLFKYKEGRTLAIKPHVGIGQMQFQARTGNAHYGYLGSWATEEGKGFGGRKIAMEVPMGLEIECNVSPRVALYFDLTTAYIDSDKLDAVPAGKHKDWVSTGNFGLRYKFRKVNKPAEPVAAAEPAVLDCEACKDAIQQAVKDAVEEALKDYQPAPVAAPAEEKADEAEVLERYFEEKDIHLSFKVGKAEVENTKANKDQVKEVSDEMEAGREIHTIKTIGYASPEGNEKQNQTLSENRAKATADYIQKELGDKAEGIQFDAKGMGSDWDGFFKALDESNIAKKAEIAETIKNADDQTAALNQMKAKYPELNSLLNSLRRTQVYINK